MAYPKQQRVRHHECFLPGATIIPVVEERLAESLPIITHPVSAFLAVDPEVPLRPTDRTEKLPESVA